MDFIKTRAAVAWAPKQPLVIEELDLMPPQKGEVLVRIVASGVCHTDAYTLDGLDAEGVFPCVLGHEGAGIVVAVGEGVSSVKPNAANARCAPPARPTSARRCAPPRARA